MATPETVQEKPKTQFFDASRAYIESLQRRPGGPTAPPERPAMELDPLRSFEREYPQFRVDLANWLQNKPEERAKRLVQLVEDTTIKKEDNQDERKAKGVRRWRLLSYVIWLETNPAKVGSRQIAQAALEAMYPR